MAKSRGETSLPRDFFVMHIVLIVLFVLKTAVGTREITLSEEIRAEIEPRDSTQQSTEPYILSTPSRLSVQIGDTVLLPCRVENLGQHVIVWTHGRSRILFSGSVTVRKDDKISLVDDSSLQISNVSPEYAGEYICQVNTAPVKELIHVLHVLVPPIITTDPKDGNVIVKKGDRVTVRCNAKGYPTPEIVWKALKGSLPGGVNKIEGTLLTIASVDTQHSGQYECTATNGVGQPAVALVKIKVLYAPEVSASPRWFHAGIGSSAEFACTASAEPAAVLFWSRHSEGILSEDNHVSLRHSAVAPGKTQLTLRIQRIIREHFGSYVCFANNSLGSALGTVEISGLAEAAKFKSNTSGDEEHSFFLLWSVKSYSPIIEYVLRIRAYKEKNSSERPGPWTEVMIPVEAQQSVFYTHGYNITGLESNTHYETVIQARNDFGWNHPSETFIFHTYGGEPLADAMDKTTAEPSLLHIRATETTAHRSIEENEMDKTAESYGITIHPLFSLTISILVIHFL